MFFSISLYVTLVIFGLGLIYKVFTWFRYKIGVESNSKSDSSRVGAAVKGVISTVFSAKIITLLKVFVLDVLLQRKVLQQDIQRWVMHILIYGGFMLLLLMHALEPIITSNLFSDVYSTVNPFMFLRDLFGFMVVCGIGIAVYRRFFSKTPRLISSAMDHYVIILIAVVMVSGILLEGTKITSYSVFQGMVEEYGDPDEEEEVNALEAYWVNDFGVVSPNVKGPFDEEILEAGKEVHGYSCMECHTPPQWAFLGYVTAKIIKPFALGLDRININRALWYIHILACFIGLAYLPFSKMFHVFASPVSLLVNAVMDNEKADPANIATRQIMELDACTHCCTCTLNCSAAAYYEHFQNRNILPSEKIASVKALASGKTLSRETLREIQEGVYVCTNCKRCTVNCPVGINLQDLWFNVREALLERGLPEFFTLSPFSFYRGLIKENGDSDVYQMPLDKARKTIAERCEFDQTKTANITITDSEKEFKDKLKLSDQAATFSSCFSCETCTNACPVVANYDKPVDALGLLPHQIMHSCALGIKELALGSNMLWDCLTCYQCQEHCPQGVSVTDVLYELKNEAVKYTKKPETNQ